MKFYQHAFVLHIASKRKLHYSWYTLHEAHITRYLGITLQNNTSLNKHTERQTIQPKRQTASKNLNLSTVPKEGKRNYVTRPL